MKILLLGSGGREHALADALARENTTIDLVAGPGNPGIAQLARVVSVDASDPIEVAELAEREQVKLVVVGPEAPLAIGLVDHLQHLGVPVFGPTMGAAKVETSKADTKALMMAAGIPTARAETHKKSADAKEAVRTRFGVPVVIKASGLAAGKGVIICHTLKEADAAIERVLEDKAFGDAGSECLVEAFMTGEELSLFAVTDGYNVMPMIGAQDHKRLLDGDEGPNTGGMGAYTPVSFSTPALVDDVTDRIFLPTLHALRKRGTPFTGLLYAGLMLTEEGPKVVEFNCRFGDPECQTLMMRLGGQILDLLQACAEHRLADAQVNWADDHAITIVMAANGYPAAYEKGTVIKGLDALPEDSKNMVFHAGTASKDGQIVATGGRVLAVTARGENLKEARDRAYAMTQQIDWPEGFYRSDIGWRAL